MKNAATDLFQGISWEYHGNIMGISWGYIGFNHQQCFFSRDVKIAPGVSSKIHHDWGIYLFFLGRS